MHGIEAFFTDWEAGNSDQWGITDSAIGGKQYCEKTIGSATNPPRNKRRPCDRYRGLAGANSVSTTAEDGLP